MNQWYGACLHPPSPLPSPPHPHPGHLKAPFQLHARTTAAVLVFIFTPAWKITANTEPGPLRTDQLPAADARTSHNLPLWFHGLKAQVPSVFLCWWWMMIVQTQHTLRTAHVRLGLAHWKNYSVHNLGSCSSFLRPVDKVGHGGDGLSLLPTCISKAGKPLLNTWCLLLYWWVCADTWVTSQVSCVSTELNIYSSQGVYMSLAELSLSSIGD